MEPAITTGKEMKPSFMERVLAEHNVTCAVDDMADAVLKSGSDDTKHKLQLQLKDLLKSSSKTRSKIVHVLANLGLMKIADAEAIFESDRPSGPEFCNGRS